MPNINLIAVRRQEKKRLERTVRLLFAGLAAETALVALVGGASGLVQMRLQNDLSRAKTRVAELQPTLEHIEEIKAETALLQPKISTLRTARADTLRWRALLQIVSQSIPSNAWLSGIAATTPSATGTPDPNADPSAAAPPAVIAISGTAGSQTLVGETMSRLGSYPVFGQVDLRFTQIDAATGGAASADGVKSTPARVKFEIGAQLKSSAPGPELSEEKQASVPDDSAPAVFLPAERQASATTTTADSTRIRRREKENHPNG